MTKEQERNELHKAIWQIANDLRGTVDGWDFKAYVLGMLFYRFISENITSFLNNEEERAGNTDFDYTKLSDDQAEFGREETIREKGYFILPSELFQNVCKNAKNNPNLNETLSNVFKNIENSAKGFESEDDLKGLFDDIDVNSNKLGGSVIKRNELLVKILGAIDNLKLGNFKDNTIDAFGDAYEFLMTMYASNAGKSGGEFFTPQEVSELLARIAVHGKRETVITKIKEFFNRFFDIISHKSDTEEQLISEKSVSGQSVSQPTEIINQEPHIAVPNGTVDKTKTNTPETSNQIAMKKIEHPVPYTNKVDDLFLNSPNSYEFTATDEPPTKENSLYLTNNATVA